MTSSVLHSFHIYWASTFLLPKGVMEEIDKIYRRFLWFGNQVKNKSATVNWQDVCMAKGCGGLGLKNQVLWNMAVLGKHVWDFASKKDALWVKWISEIYLKGENF